MKTSPSSPVVVVTTVAAVGSPNSTIGWDVNIALLEDQHDFLAGWP
jgi:hypothetical protein